MDIEEKILEMQKLKPNWDSYGGKRASKRCVKLPAKHWGYPMTNDLIQRLENATGPA